MTSPLLGAAQIRQRAAALDLRPSKQRGQNFVIDPNTVQRIARDAGVGAEDHVLEVGPGLGSLTLALLQTGAQVTAIEVDARLAGEVARVVADHAPDAVDRFRVVHADALGIEEIDGPPPTALVANLPYNVSVPVLLHLLTLLPSIASGLVMVQAEVADRLTARPGTKSYGTPTVKLAWFAATRRAGSVGRHVFWPAPRVESGLVAWQRHEQPATHVTREQVFAVIDAAFAQRRKALRGALGGLAGGSAPATAALETAGIDPLARGETLELADFVRLTEALASGADA